MLLGISLATELGLIAGLIHVFNHAIIKVALFLSVALIIYLNKTDSISQLAGIAKTMPVTIASFLIAGLSMIGVPLTAGFISKWYLIKASLAAGYWVLVLIIVFSSMLAIVYIGKVIEVAYFRQVENGTLTRDNNKKPPYLLLLSLLLFVAANIYFGVETSVNVEIATQIARDFFA